jgi:hypothetical protein
MDRFNPPIFEIIRIPTPAETNDRVRKVQGGISISAIFMTGQLKPQNKLMAISSK